MTSHFHPSVSHFANSILEGSDIKYNGDPLQDFTTMRFLDRFVFRNPKKTDLTKGTSVFNKRNQYRPKGIKSLAPDSKEYLSKDLEQIPIDERFIYKYLKEKRSKDTEEAESDAESVNSEEFNEVLKEGMDPVDLDFAANIDETEMDQDSEESEHEENESEDEADLQSLDSLSDDASETEELEKEDFED